ncbi:MAG: hypothetical protein VKK42_30485 [Lyngbya sp.]|nr:hypothetical protein [Lyngbya sp.]
MTNKSNTLTSYCSTSSLGRYLTVDETTVYAYSIGQLFSLVAKLIWLFILLGLLGASLVVWIWIVSFRNGWGLWDWVWANRSKTESQIAAGVSYGLIISLVTPFVLLFNWAQKLLKQANLLPESFPDQINLLKIVEKQLQIPLGNRFPFLLKSQEQPSAEETQSNQ